MHDAKSIEDMGNRPQSELVNIGKKKLHRKNKTKIGELRRNRLKQEKSNNNRLIIKTGFTDTHHVQFINNNTTQ